MTMRVLTLHPDTEPTVVRDATEARALVEGAVSGLGDIEDEKQLLDDGAAAAEGHVPETQSANETHDPRQRSAGVEEAARPRGKEPGDYADEQQKDLLHARKKQEEDDREKADENLELGDREEVSGGNITAPVPPASGESAVTSEGRAPGPAADDEERAQAAAKADQARAEAAGAADQARAEAAGAADQARAEAAGAADQARAEAAGAADQARAEAAGEADQARAEAAGADGTSRREPKTRSGSDAQPRRASPERKPG